MRAQTRRNTGAALAGIAVIGGLAACSSGTTDASDDSAAPSTSANEESSSGADSTTAAYTDGEYTAEGAYTTPGGQESVTVTVMLEGDVVTSLEVEGSGGSPNTQRYQGEFIDNIQDEVVGKDIDDLAVSKVAGSSLTSEGFNAAIETIKTDAAS